MPDLPPYKRDTVCPKCGHDVIDTLYCEICDGSSRSGRCDWCQDACDRYLSHDWNYWSQDVPKRFRELHEHYNWVERDGRYVYDPVPVFHRKCLGCKWQWNEKPKEGTDGN